MFHHIKYCQITRLPRVVNELKNVLYAKIFSISCDDDGDDEDNDVNDFLSA